MRKKFLALAVTFAVSVSVIGCGNTKDFAVKTLEEFGVCTEQLQNISAEDFDSQTNKTTNTKNITETIPKYSGSAWVKINSNKPFFTENDYTSKAFEKYSDLDSLGRCGAAFANICKDIMPAEERGEIGMVKPSGWHTVKYNGLIEGNYLYNRCHLIGYQLAGENANEKNLITGTRYLNITGMLLFENQVADYIDENPDNHVLYRVTPEFKGKNLLASVVLMEAYSVEDKGKGIQFCVYCYNVQPGIKINYKTGDSAVDKDYNGKYATEDSFGSDEKEREPEKNSTKNKIIGKETTYVVNTNTGKFHKPDCESVCDMASENLKQVKDSREKLIEEGYSPCKNCRP